MKLYRHHTETDNKPYFDKLYVSADDIKQNELDVEVQDLYAYLAFAKVSQIDYIQFRNKCKEVFLPNWNALGEDVKKELVRHNITPSPTESLSCYTLEEQFENYLEIVRLEIMARTIRWNLAMKTAAFDLLNNQLAQLQMYNDTKAIKGDYIEADLPNLILWVTSGSYPALGIDFTTTGFASKPYYSESIKNKVVQILTK